MNRLSADPEDSEEVEAEPARATDSKFDNLTGKQFKNPGLHQVLFALFSFHGEAEVTAALV